MRACQMYAKNRTPPHGIGHGGSANTTIGWVSVPITPIADTGCWCFHAAFVRMNAYDTTYEPWEVRKR